MNEFTVSERDSGQRLDKYIARLIPLAPRSFLYKALRNKDIRLNGKKAEGSEELKSGDRILFRFPDVQFRDLGGKPALSAVPAGPGIVSKPEESGEEKRQKLDPKFGTVLYEDADILLADKKSGILSQKAKPEDFSINEALLSFCGGRTATFTPSVCNRLDRNTSGLIIFAKTYRGAREMTEALRERSASKFYLAAVKGAVTEPAYRKARLRRRVTDNRVEILAADADEGELIETSYEPLLCTEKNGQKVSLLKIKLITGKTHQIRAHLASAGMPVLGDGKYGSGDDFRKMNCSRLMLHSYELDLPGRGVFYAPIPEEFQKLFSISDKL